MTHKLWDTSGIRGLFYYFIDASSIGTKLEVHLR